VSKAKWNPVDVIVAGLALLLAVIMLMTGISPLVRGESLAGEKAKMLSSALNSLISVITLYIGAKLQENRERSRDKREHRKEDPPDDKGRES